MSCSLDKADVSGSARSGVGCAARACTNTNVLSPPPVSLTHPDYAQVTALWPCSAASPLLLISASLREDPGLFMLNTPVTFNYCMHHISFQLTIDFF